MDLPQGHMQGQLSTTVTPEKDLSRVDLAARGLWGLGVESLSANCRVDFSLIGVVVPMCTIVTDQSRGDLLCIPMTPAPKTQKTTVPFPRKSSVQDERCAVA